MQKLESGLAEAHAGSGVARTVAAKGSEVHVTYAEANLEDLISPVKASLDEAEPKPVTPSAVKASSSLSQHRRDKISFVVSGTRATPLSPALGQQEQDEFLQTNIAPEATSG